MEIKETKKRNVEIITDIICDCCGESCKKYESTVDNPIRHDHGEKFYVHEFMKLEAHWGYYSESKDTEKWTAQICEKCVDEKFSFIKFKKEQYL